MVTGVATRLATRLDAVVDAALRESRLVGTVVMVVRRGEPVYRRAAGWADRESGRPMRQDTLFRLASLSKLIVSTAAMVLVSQRRLALDDPIDRWLPYFRPVGPDGAAARITVRHLMTHCAGLSYRFLEADACGPYARAGVSDGMDRSDLSLEQNLRRLAAVPLLNAPGAASGYSLATDVLGAVVEAAAGLPLGAAVRSLVTEPAAMRDTGFLACEPRRLCVPYVNDGPVPRRLGARENFTHDPAAIGICFEPARATDPTQYPSAGAGMVGTAGDFLRLLEILRRGGAPLLPRALVDEMGRPQAGAQGPTGAPGQCFGLASAVLRDPRAAGSPESMGTWSWGGAYGHVWSLDRAAGISLVALTNTAYEGMSGRFVTALRDAAYG
jgi:CubicO group peptidase (beta-lactamase class C family)